MIILIVFAILSGIMTVLSPCILPFLPLLLAAGADRDHKKPIGIIIGLIVSFSFFTLFLTTIVHTTGISPTIFRYIAITIIMLSGLAMIFPIINTFFTRLTSVITHLGSTLETKASMPMSPIKSGLIVGMALGMIWSPCAGPILATITSLTALQHITGKVILITFAYSLGSAIPMLLILYGGSTIVHVTQKLTPHTETIRKIFGILMIIGAIAITLQSSTFLQILTLKYFPTVIVDDTESVKKRLTMLRLEQQNQPLLNKQAPSLIGITQWLNSSPLSLDQLHGKIVLLDFWTYSCINCIRTLPHLVALYEKYKNNDFVIIGVHTPEFAFEKSEINVQKAVKNFSITYPVALDNNYATWNAYNNHYWPTHYLINREGIIVDVQVGEGNYAKTENIIQTLLGLATLTQTCQPSAIRAFVTPEIYLGYARARNYHPEIMLKQNDRTYYHYTIPLPDDHVGLTGSWFVTEEFIRSEDDNCSIDLNFFAEQVCIVMESPQPQTITMLLDGKKIPKSIDVHKPKMYTLFHCENKCERHTLTLKCPKGVMLYTFTFG